MKVYLKYLRILLLLQLVIFNVVVGDAQERQVVLSSRSFHPKDISDKLNTMKMISLYGVDRIDWLYSSDSEKLGLLKSLGVPFSLAINPQVPDSLEYTSTKTRIVDVKGKPIRAPWMIGWKVKNPYWGCVNNPLFRKIFTLKSKEIVDLGAYGIFVDDARFNDHAVEWGGCFCQFCLEGFNKYLKQNDQSIPVDFKYKGSDGLASSDRTRYFILFKRFQHQSVLNFLNEWKSEVQSYANKPFKFLTNNPNGSWQDIYSIFDVGIAEINEKGNPYSKVKLAIKAAANLKKKQVFSFASQNDLNNLSFYLYSSLNNQESLLPWDLYIPGNNSAVTRVYMSDNLLLPLVKYLKEQSAEIKNAVEIAPASIGITYSPNTIVLCKRLRDGTILIFAANYGQTLQARISFNSKSQPLQVIPSLNYNAIINRRGTQNQILGQFIFVKYNSTS